MLKPSDPYFSFDKELALSEPLFHLNMFEYVHGNGLSPTGQVKKKIRKKNIHFGVGGIAVACVVAGGGAGQCTLFVLPLSIEVSQILGETSLVNWYR